MKNLLLIKVLEIFFLISEIQGLYKNFSFSVHLFEGTNVLSFEMQILGSVLVKIIHLFIMTQFSLGPASTNGRIFRVSRNLHVCKGGVQTQIQ